MNSTYYYELYYTLDNCFAYGTVWQGVTSKPTITNSYLVTDLTTIKGDAAKNTMPNLDWENIWTVSLYPVYKTGFVCTNHIFSEWDVEFVATVYDKGVSTRVCSVCGYTETVETEKLPTEKGVIKLLGATRIVFTETENIQYSLNGTDWHNSNIFTGLNADTEYNIYVRRINSVTGKLSGISEALVVKTLSKDNILGEFSSAELSCIRKQLLNDGNALWADINADSLINVLDIIRAKNIAAGLYEYPKGDINEDGYVDESDALLISEYLNGNLENIPTYNADINGDGVLNQSDTELIK